MIWEFLAFMGWWGFICVVMIWPAWASWQEKRR